MGKVAIAWSSTSIASRRPHDSQSKPKGLRFVAPDHDEVLTLLDPDPAVGA
jgi:hypothetical protein